MDQAWSSRNGDMAGNGTFAYNQSPRHQQPPVMNTAQNGDFDGDMSMEDAGDLDPYNKQKYEDVSRTAEYPTRQPMHQSRPSSQYYPQQEESSAARRYSPMKLSATPTNATTPYTSYTPSGQTSSSRTSPTRPSLYASHSNSYYSSPRTFTHIASGTRCADCPRFRVCTASRPIFSY